MVGILLSSFLLGLVSSGHCIGMCGGILTALTVGVRTQVHSRPMLHMQYLFAYNSGRIISYGVMGLMLGLLHWLTGQLPWVSSISESWMSWGHLVLQTLGATVLFILGLNWMGLLPSGLHFYGIGRWFWRRLEPVGRKLLPVQTRAQAVLYGLVWGWLPCGLVYTTVVYAASQASSVQPVFTMLAFGLGTLPALLLVGVSAHSVLKWTASAKFRLLAGFLLCCMALATVFFAIMMQTTHAHHHMHM